MKRNNRGFTLVEMIVATAILGIIAVGIFGFMSAGAGSYRSVSGNVQLQTIAQQTVSQIQEAAMDCRTALFTDGEALYMLSRDDGGGYTVCAYTRDGTTLNYQELSGVTDGTEETEITESERHLLTEDVTDFSVAVNQKPGKAAVSAITVTIHFDRQGKTCETTQTIALRNAPDFQSSLSTLIACAKP